MASGNWICIVGDDDLVIPTNLKLIISKLSLINSEDWVMLPALNSLNPKSSWLSSLVAGRYSSFEIYLLILRLGVGIFGFIGCHIFSSKYKSEFLKIPLDISEFWIHQNYWFMHLIADRQYEVIDVPFVEVNSNFKTEVYSREKWASLWLQRLNNFINVNGFVRTRRKYLYAILFSEFFSVSQLKEWARFAIYYPRTSVIRLKKIQANIYPREQNLNKFIASYLFFIKSIFYLIGLNLLIFNKFRRYNTTQQKND